MENIKEQAKKDVESAWENKLKNEFAEKANQGIEEALVILDSELNGFNINLNQLFEDLDKKFDEEWNPKFSNMISELEQIFNNNNNFSEIKNINNNINNDDNFHIFNENQKNNKNIFIDQMNDNISNNINNDLIENNNFNLGNNNYDFFNNNNNNNNINNIDNNNNNYNMNNYNRQNNMNNQNNNNNFNMNNYSNINNQNNMNNQNNIDYQNNIIYQNTQKIKLNLNNNDNNWINQNNNMNFQINSNNNNNFESDEFLRKKKVDYSKFNNPPLIIFIEQDNTNQLVNLILRCLSNILTILPYYFNPNKEEKILKKSKEDPNGAYLGPSFLKLLDNIWKSSKKEYCPMEFHIALKQLMGNNYYSNNPGFIMEFILNQLDRELDLNAIVNMDDNDNHLNPNISFNLFLQRFEKNQTKISNCFFSTIKTQKKCSFCQQSTYYFHMTPVVNIILESNNDNTFFNQLNLNEHLNNLLTKEKNENINEFCSKCNCQRIKYLKEEIFYSFDLIIFNINREKDPGYQLSFNYPEKFNGSKLINKDYNLHDYQLISVIKKNPNENNNFIAYCKSFTNTKWYSYYKQNISMVQNTNEIIDNKNACLLIYSDIKV